MILVQQIDLAIKTFDSAVLKFFNLLKTYISYFFPLPEIYLIKPLLLLSALEKKVRNEIGKFIGIFSVEINTFLKRGEFNPLHLYNFIIDFIERKLLDY